MKRRTLLGALVAAVVALFTKLFGRREAVAAFVPRRHPTGTVHMTRDLARELGVNDALTYSFELRPGDLIFDNHERLGVVVTNVVRPPAEWLAQQSDPRVREAAENSNDRWWEVFPLMGGSIIVPASLATFVRVATYADYDVLAHGGYRDRVDALLAALPENGAVRCMAEEDALRRAEQGLS